MSTTDRAVFEQYAESQGCRDFEYDQDDSQRYRNPFTQREYKYWRAALDWQAATEAAKAEPAEFKGWYCAHCQRGVDASEVTYHEQHTVCGRLITDDRPPATKATGTAGELPPLIGMEVSMDVSTGDEDFDHRIFGRIEGLMAKGDGTDIILAVEESRNFATDTQAARQPAPVVSSDLRNAAQLIMDLYDDMRMGKESIPAFDALRAALAATAAPVLSDEQIKEAAMQAWPNLPENWWERKGEVWNGAKVFALAILAATNRSQP